MKRKKVRKAKTAIPKGGRYDDDSDDVKAYIRHRVDVEVQTFREYMQNRLDQRDAFINILVNSLRDTTPVHSIEKLNEVIRLVKELSERKS